MHTEPLEKLDIVTRFYDLLSENAMLEPMILKKKAAPAGLVMALDFESSSPWTDSALPTRAMTVYQSNSPPSVITGGIAGSKCFSQAGYIGSGRATLATPISNDLVFTGDFWVEWWSYFLGVSASAGNRTMYWSYGYWTSGSSQGLQAASIDTNKFGFHDTNTNDSTFTAQHPTVISQNVWTHLALGRSGTQLYLFVNGVPNTPITWTGTLGVKTQPNLAIGGYFDSRLGPTNSYGTSALQMDRMRFYNRCLYTSTFTPSTGLYPN